MLKPQKKQVVIIGAGIGGLSCAARLAAAGLSVMVLEQNDYAGGKLGLLQEGGYTWDTGPSLFTQPWLLEELFQSCGRRLEDFFRYRSLNEGTQYFWEDGESFHAAPERDALMANAAQAFGKEESARFARYLDDAARLYENIGSIFLDEPIQRLRAWRPRRIFPALNALKLSYLSRSLHGYNARCIRHPKLVQVLDRMATYNGSDPYQCPAMLSMIAHLEFGEGAWHPEGGMIAIPRALRALCEELGVTFMTGARVQRIGIQNNCVTGVDAGGERIPAGAVVSNADVYHTYKNLLGDEAKRKKIAAQERSSSGVVFYWGMNRCFPQLRLHNIFFSKNYSAEFDALFHKKMLPADPTVYINISSKIEAAHAAPGGENWFVLINAPARHQALSEEEIAVLRKTVLEKLSRILATDIAQHITVERMLTPADIDLRTDAYMGALYGTASNNPMAAFRRHANFSTKYHGLFFAGGTVHPGGGIPLCMRSGKLAANEVLRYLQ